MEPAKSMLGDRQREDREAGMDEETLKLLHGRIARIEQTTLQTMRRLAALELLLVRKGLVTNGEIKVPMKDLEATTAVDEVFDERHRALARFNELIDKKIAGKPLSSEELKEAVRLSQRFREEGDDTPPET
jgi:hypothetical protein